MMRIRQIKPSFWSDSTMADLAESTRLFYIGLWMIADDAGWLRWDGREVAKDLYGYDSRRRRETRVDRMLAELVDAHRVVRHDCGHLEIPTLTRHQRLAGATKQVRTSENDHLRHCVSADPLRSPQESAGARRSPPWNGEERYGTERGRNGTERNGSARDLEGHGTETEFQRLVPRPQSVSADGAETRARRQRVAWQTVRAVQSAERNGGGDA